MKFILFSFYITLSLPTYAFNGPENGGLPANVYSFAGKCTSQGAWTAAALQQTAELKTIIRKLKDNEACKGLKDSVLNSMEIATQQLQELDKLKAYTPKNQGLLNNVEASRNFMQMEMFPTISQVASPVANSVKELFITSTVLNKASSIVEPYLSSKGPTQAATLVGLSMINHTMKSFQDAKADCLDPSIGASLGAGFTKIVSAFLNSGVSPVSNEMTNTIQVLGDYLTRNKVYLEALHTLNDEEFITSLSCLLETISEGYCSARDAKQLLDHALTSMAARVETVQKKNPNTLETQNIEVIREQPIEVVRGQNNDFRLISKNSNYSDSISGPLAGYYIVSRQVPIISEWLQKLQYGLPPQNQSESDFKNTVLVNMLNTIIVRTEIEGNFNKNARTLKNPNLDIDSKRGYLLQTIVQLMTDMNRASSRQGSTENFYTSAKPIFYTVFELLGMEVPDAVLGRGGPNEVPFVNNAIAYLNAKYKTLPVFNNPDAAVDEIAKRLVDVLKRVEKNATEYYMQFYIVDKPQIIQDSMIGLDANVKEALRNIDLYLADLQRRLTLANPNLDENPHAITIGNIIDTRVRIGRVLARYRELHAFAKELIVSKKDSATLTKDMEIISRKLLEEVYIQFQVMLARITFLEKRLNSFVMYDYTVAVREGTDLSQDINHMLFATGYDKLLSMFQAQRGELPTTSTNNDIQNAMKIYSKNIQALEPLLMRPLVNKITEYRYADQPLSKLGIYKKALDDAYKSGLEQVPGEQSNQVQRILRANIQRSLYAFFNVSQSDYTSIPVHQRILEAFKITGRTLVGRPNPPANRLDTEFNSAQHIMTMLCTQSLAFSNLAPYWYSCKDSVLATPLRLKDTNDLRLKKVYDEVLSINYRKKAWEEITPDKIIATAKPGQPGHYLYQQKLNLSKRTCALRDYHRLNEVVRVTAAMRSAAPNYKSIYENLYKDAEAAPNLNPPPAPATGP